MKRTFALLSIAAATVALATAPALAKSKKHHRHHHGAYYAQPYAYGPAPAWTSRTVSSDPSFGNRVGINMARSYGRCVADLGYGRFEYCGW